MEEERGGRTQFQTTPQQPRSRNVVGALFLIFLGIIFLLNTTGVVPWNIWTILLRFWPVLIILAGLQIMLGKSMLAGWIISLTALIIFIVIGISALAIIHPNILQNYNIHLPEWWVSTLSDAGEIIQTQHQIPIDEYSDIEQLQLTLHIGAAEFNITDTKNDSILLINATHWPNLGAPGIHQLYDDGRLLVEFEQLRHGTQLWSIPSNIPRYDFIIGHPELNTTLAVDMGAGKGMVQLSGSTMSLITAKVGAGELHISLTEHSLPEFIGVEVGAGSATLILPEDVGYQLNYEVGVGSLKLEDTELGGIGRSDRVYTSRNFETAEQKVEIEVNVGVGSLEIRQQ